MRRFNKLTKFIAWLLIVTISAQIASQSLYAVEGAATPETAQFEPVDTSDLVNLYTGDLAYNLPLLEVLGPEGAWPINISYHAGVGPNTEATWVGLGWSLNPGSINRFVSGFPDDFLTGIQDFYTKQKLAEGHSWGVGLTISGVMAGISYDTFEGYGFNVGLGLTKSLSVGVNVTQKNVNLSLTLSVPLTGSDGKNTGWGVGSTLTVGTSGVGLSHHLSRQIAQNSSGESYSIGGSIGVHSKSGMHESIGFSGNKKSSSLTLIGASFSSNQSGANFTSAGTGFNQQSSSMGDVSVKSSGFSAFIPVGIIWGNPFDGVNLSYAEYEYWLKLNDVQGGVGSLYNVSRNDINWTKTFSDLRNGINLAYDDYQKFSGIPQDITILNPNQIPMPSVSDRTVLNNNRVISAEDIYQVSVQGLSGRFQPYFDYSYRFDDWFDYDQNMNMNSYYSLSASYVNSTDHVRFRFENETGGNFVTLQGYLNNDIQPISSNSQQNGYGGKKIYPAVDQFGTIVGFQIKSEDGKIYEFFQPVMDYGNHFKVRDKSQSKKSTTWTSSPYASSWLLTGIKGPDYLDRGTQGFSSDDWGFWVKFKYEESNSFVFWRAPFAGSATLYREPGETTFSSGLRDRVYLESIETATHLARFHKSSRLDDSPSYEASSADIGKGWSNVSFVMNGTSSGSKSVRFSTNRWEITSQTTAKIFFNMSKAQLASLIPCERSLIAIKYAPNGNSLALKDKISTNTMNWSQSCVIEVNFMDVDATCEFTGTVNILTDANAIEDHGSFCAINASFSNINLYQDKIVASTLFIRLPENNPPNTAKKLDKITLHKKTIDPQYVTNYALTYNSEVLQSYEFGYDYSLCQNSPNSAASTKGKLTLKQIKSVGITGTQLLPAMNFSYGFNPSYSQFSVNSWGGYAGSNYYGKLSSDQDAGAWCLKTVETPLGSTINIEYESDIIRYVGNQTPTGFGRPIGLQFDQGEHDYAYIRDNDQLEFVKYLFQKGYNHYKFRKKTGFVQYKVVPTYDQQGSDCAVDFWNTTDDLFDMNILSIVGDRVNFDQWFTFNPDVEGPECTSYESFQYMIYPDAVFGGGHRVKSIAVDDGVDRFKTIYDYYGGNTPVLPSEMRGKHDNKFSFDTKGYLDFKYNILGASPSVGYSKVEVYDVNKDDQIINGKTEFNYFTALEFPFAFDSTHAFDNSGTFVRKISITDKTGMIGQLKKIVKLGLKPAVSGINIGDFYKIQEDEFLYMFSSDLVKNTITPINGNEIDKRKRSIFFSESNVLQENQPLGVNQRMYKSTSPKIEENVYVTSHYDHRKENTFLVGTKSTYYHYSNDNFDSPTGQFYSSTQNIGFDAKSGSVILSKSVNSKQEMLFEELFPAFWKYPILESKNMLSQNAMTRTYIVSGSTDFLDMSPAAKNNTLVASSVTTWKNWLSSNVDHNNDGVIDFKDEVWRPNDSYVATKIGSSYVDFDKWSMYDNEDNNPHTGDILTGWKRVSNITQYDRFGHPVEERGTDGNYTSSLYGYGDALPIAIATNSRKSKIQYLNFEENTGASVCTTDAKTGKQSMKQSGLSNSLTAFADISGTKYVMSGWIKPQSTTTLSASGVPSQVFVSNGEWQFFEFQLDQAQALTVTGNANDLFDDIRIHPASSQMSTFTYDPLTWKVTAIADANNIITYYEYDAAGRLIRVLDQDKNILKNHKYFYQRNGN